MFGHEDAPADDTAEEIECEIPSTAEHPFDIVAEHPQEDHVAHDVRDIRMKELVGDDGEESRYPSPRAGVADEGCGHETEGIDDAIKRELARSHLIEQDREIERDQAPGDHRLHRRGEWIVVGERDDHAKARITHFFLGATAPPAWPWRWRGRPARRGS